MSTEESRAVEIGEYEVETRECKKCKQSKPLDQFRKYEDRWHKHTCRKCENKKSKKGQPYRNRLDRARYLWRKYLRTELEDHDTMQHFIGGTFGLYMESDGSSIYTSVLASKSAVRLAGFRDGIPIELGTIVSGATEDELKLRHAIVNRVAREWWKLDRFRKGHPSNV